MMGPSQLGGTRMTLFAITKINKRLYFEAWKTDNRKGNPLTSACYTVCCMSTALIMKVTS